MQYYFSQGMVQKAIRSLLSLEIFTASPEYVPAHKNGP